MIVWYIDFFNIAQNFGKPPWCFYDLTGSLCLLNKAVTMFENDECFKVVEQARDKEGLFESCIVELERKIITGHFFSYTCHVDFTSWSEL